MSKAYVVDTFNPREVTIIDTIEKDGERFAIVEYIDKPGLRFAYPIADVLVVAEADTISQFVSQ